MKTDEAWRRLFPNIGSGYIVPADDGLTFGSVPACNDTREALNGAALVSTDYFMTTKSA